MLRDHSFRTYTNFPKNLYFLPPDTHMYYSPNNTMLIISNKYTRKPSTDLAPMSLLLNLNRYVLNRVRTESYILLFMGKYGNPNSDTFYAVDNTILKTCNEEIIGANVLQD